MAPVRQSLCFQSPSGRASSLSQVKVRVFVKVSFSRGVCKELYLSLLVIQATSAQTLSLTDRREAAVTRMLVVMCVTFTLCTIPTVTLSFVRNLVPGFLPSGRYTKAFYASNSLMHLFSALNCSLNFFIYYAMGSRFRATLRGLAARSRSRSARGAGGSSRESVHKTASSGSCTTTTTTV